MEIDEKQIREVAVKFARDAIRLVEKGKPLDVCARKLQAAATILSNELPDVVKELREELVAQKTMLGVAVRDLQLCRAALEKANTELTELRARYVDSAIREHGVTVDSSKLGELAAQYLLNPKEPKK